MKVSSSGFRQMAAMSRRGAPVFPLLLFISLRKMVMSQKLGPFKEMETIKPWAIKLISFYWKISGFHSPWFWDHVHFHGQLERKAFTMLKTMLVETEYRLNSYNYSPTINKLVVEWNIWPLILSVLDSRHAMRVRSQKPDRHGKLIVNPANPWTWRLNIEALLQ